MPQYPDARQGHLTSYVVIPARLASTRLPGKLLLRETGKSVLQHTYEAASSATRPSGVCVAAADRAIAQEVRSFGGAVKMTNPDAASGTDRIAEVARDLPGVDIVVNVQGDEPELPGSAVDMAVKLLEEHPRVVMSTLATPIRCARTLHDPSCVKVVFDESGRALYFSRSPIPHVRDGDLETRLAANPPIFFLHVGLYAYRREFLQQITTLPPSRLERLECLEQLRVLTAGYPIQVGVIDEPTVGIDTAADYEAFRARMRLRRSA